MKVVLGECHENITEAKVLADPIVTASDNTSKEEEKDPPCVTTLVTDESEEIEDKEEISSANALELLIL